MISRAENGTEQLLAAARLRQEQIAELASAIVRAAEGSAEPRPARAVAALTGSDEPEGSEPSEPQP